MVADADVRGTSDAAIDINFVTDRAMKVSIIAGGAIKDQSTHHLSVRLSRPGGEQSAPGDAKPAARIATHRGR